MSGKPNDETSGEGNALLLSRLAEAEREIEDLRTALTSAALREQRLASEVQHRVRNMLAVLRTILRRSQAYGASRDEFAAHFEGRLDVIAKYQTDLRDVRADGVDLDDVVRDQLQRAGYISDRRYEISGPYVLLSGKALELLALAIHELTMNSVKFGALFGDGHLAIEWSIARRQGVRMLDFRWIESGIAPLAQAPRAQGFGRKFIEEALPYELGGSGALLLKPGRCECLISVPLPRSGNAGTEPPRDG